MFSPATAGRVTDADKFPTASKLILVYANGQHVVFVPDRTREVEINLCV